MVATAPALCVDVGRITEQAGRFGLRNSHGSGRILLGWRPSLCGKTGNVTPVSGSVKGAKGLDTAFAALSCHSEKWSTSTPPMLTTIRRTSRSLTLRHIVEYRLDPPCSMNAK